MKYTTEQTKQEKNKNVYIFRVSLDFDEDIFRDIAILGTQTFEDFHSIIFNAFDRFDPHLYYFYYKNSRIWAHEYEPDELDFDAAKTKIQDIKLKQEDCFLYTFDLGDEWEHTIELIDILPIEAGISYPVIINKQGKSPAQYGTDEEPEIILHPIMLKMIKKQRSDWRDKDFLFVDECTNCPTLNELETFVREDILVFKHSEATIISIQKLSSLFRDCYVDEEALAHLFFETISDVTATLIEDKVISYVSNAEFFKIFLSISKDPNKLSKSFLYNMIWKTCVIFLLQYECDEATFKYIIKELRKTIKANKALSFYEFCQLESEEDDDE